MTFERNLTIQHRVQNFIIKTKLQFFFMPSPLFHQATIVNFISTKFTYNMINVVTNVKHLMYDVRNYFIPSKKIVKSGPTQCLKLARKINKKEKSSYLPTQNQNYMKQEAQILFSLASALNHCITKFILPHYFNWHLSTAQERRTSKQGSVFSFKDLCVGIVWSGEICQ